MSGVIVFCNKWCQDLPCVFFGLNSYTESSILYSVTPNIAECPLSDVPSTVDSTSWAAPTEEYLLQNMT